MMSGAPITIAFLHGATTTAVGSSPAARSRVFRIFFSEIQERTIVCVFITCFTCFLFEAFACFVF